MTPDPPVRVPGGFLTLHGYLPAALIAYAERVIGTACELWAEAQDEAEEEAS